MPYRNLPFETNQPLHIVSHGIEERQIFDKKEDCYRFMFQIYAANVGKPALNLWKKDVIKAAQSLLQGEKISSQFVIEEHLPLVYILEFSLVINHYHFYLLPNEEGMVPLFMKKLNGGFAKYYNLKHQRTGTLFGSRYKSILIKTEAQSSAVSQYVNLINPLDVYQPGWRKKGLKNWKQAYQFLETYQFSSFPDKIGKRTSKIIAPKEILKRYNLAIENKQEYSLFVKDFLKQNFSSFSDSFIE